MIKNSVIIILSVLTLFLVVFSNIKANEANRMAMMAQENLLEAVMQKKSAEEMAKDIQNEKEQKIASLMAELEACKDSK